MNERIERETWLAPLLSFYPLYRAHHTTVLIYWLTLCARPIIESIGLTPEAAGERLPSHTNNPLIPLTRPFASVTHLLGSATHPHLPHSCSAHTITPLAPLPYRPQ